jgi:endonuclease-3
MAVGFGHQRIAVDTHVFRVSNRIGLAQADNVEKTEEQLKKNLPEGRWSLAHHLLIFHGRYCCAARKPECGRCPVRDLCKYYLTCSV